MERKAFARHFGIRPKQIGLYGHTVRAEAIARNILTDLLARSSVTHVFIMFDREARTESSKRLARTVTEVILKELPDINVCVAVPDQDIECWLFSDHEVTSKVLRAPLGKKSRFEGSKGVEALARYVGPGKYKKIKHGVRLLGEVRWKVIAQRSASAGESGIGEFFDTCAWLAA